ncbi:TadE/TadG family type IV pilus assembly protein [Paenibacillus sp.]|uniref:TadE/TadG family type IV pilus assembly protein n=1 Tax=Paenibacillus sp. TaxID=58172 RepID=UPI002D7106EC|nr:TadE/TadG family type IV pilus assembly protein [Paenibacillus sp.]HZG58584.1 TadE/TadG family type IV pilus assembly protein [Paenibacillus sp.]
MRTHLRWLRDERGQSLTEFALVAPLLLLLVFGILDLGRYFYAHLSLQLTAQETVRLGGLGRSDEELRTFAAAHFGTGGASALTVTIEPGDASRDSGDYVTVTLEQPFAFVTPLANELLSTVANVSATSTIRVE